MYWLGGPTNKGRRSLPYDRVGGGLSERAQCFSVVPFYYLLVCFSSLGMVHIFMLWEALLAVCLGGPGTVHISCITIVSFTSALHK
jgi:hypothetical protein